MKRFFLLSVLVMVAALALAACGGPATPEGPQGDATKGQTNFQTVCVSCHGPDAKGMPGLGKDLTISTFVKSKNNAEMVAFLQVGRPASDPLNTVGVDMPPRGGNPAFTDQDLADIVAYLRTINNP